MNYNYPQARELTEILINAVKNKEGFFYLAVSGGNGASVLFKLWRDIYSALIPWEKIELFWVDERCVPADHPESNYGNAKKSFWIRYLYWKAEYTESKERMIMFRRPPDILNWYAN